MLRYRTNATDTSGMYLRLVALDQFDGLSWKSSVRPIVDVPERLPWPEGLAQDVRVTEVTGNFVASGNYERSGCPCRTRPPGSTSRELAVRAGRPDAGRRRQADHPGRPLPGGQSGRAADGGAARRRRTRPQELRTEYTKVPPSLPADVKATALRVTEGARNDYERAVRLQDWFARDGGFRYDVDVKSGTGCRRSPAS